VDVGWSKLSDLNVHEGKLLGCSYNQSCVGVWVVDLVKETNLLKGCQIFKIQITGRSFLKNQRFCRVSCFLNLSILSSVLVLAIVFFSLLYSLKKLV
jgi:hypothetical protein